MNATSTTKPTPAPEPKLAPAAAPKPSRQQIREAADRDRAAELQRLREFLNLDADDLEAIHTVKLIRRRSFCGVDDPISKFLANLLHRYIWAEDRGEGMTIEDVESEMEELRENIEEAISEAYFIADRYPRPEPKADTEEARS